jgi:hypothetical protein
MSNYWFLIKPNSSNTIEIFIPLLKDLFYIENILEVYPICMQPKAAFMLGIE